MELSRRNFVEGSLAMGAAAGVSGLGIASQAEAEEAAQPFDYAALNSWLKERTNYSAFRGYHHGGTFLEGEENAPTNEQIIEILKIANSYMYCHALTAPHFIVIRDPEEQNAVLSKMQTTHSGTVTLLALSDGARDQEHHEELYNAADDPLDYWQLNQGLIELGEALAYLNLAARSLGFRIRNFSALSLENLSELEGITGDHITADGHEWYGNWDVLQGYGPDFSKYAVGKDGVTEFTHYSLEIDRDISVGGNLSVHFAIVIGKVDEDDLATNVSDHKAWVGRTCFPADQRRKEFNWAIWDDSFNGASLYEPDEDFKQAVADFEAEHADDVEDVEVEIPADAKYGTATGFWGNPTEVAVVTDENGVITAVYVTEESDSPNLGGQAAKVMPERFVGLSTAEEIQAVDGFTGATYSSQAIRDAVQAALGL